MTEALGRDSAPRSVCGGGTLKPDALPKEAGPDWNQHSLPREELRLLLAPSGRVGLAPVFFPSVLPWITG